MRTWHRHKGSRSLCVPCYRHWSNPGASRITLQREGTLQSYGQSSPPRMNAMAFMRGRTAKKRSTRRRWQTIAKEARKGHTRMLGAYVWPAQICERHHGLLVAPPATGSASSHQLQKQTTTPTPVPASAAWVIDKHNGEMCLLCMVCMHEDEEGSAGEPTVQPWQKMTTAGVRV